MLYLAGTLYRTPRQITGLLFYLDRPKGWLVSSMYPNISGYLMEKKKEKAGSEVNDDFHFKVFFSPNFSKLDEFTYKPFL
jgi:hypothetical protein